MKTDHVVIIRFHYKHDDPRFAWRFAYFQSMVLPRLLEQTDKRFDIAIWCNPWHASLFRGLSKRIQTFNVKTEVTYKSLGGKKYFVDFAPWSAVEGLMKYDIQTGVDSDDLVGPHFIETIHDFVKENGDKRSLHISFQPRIFDARTLTTRPIGTTYTPRKGSAFMSLYQPKKKKYHFIYEDSHLRLWRLADHSITVPEGHAWATVHGINESTGK